LARHGATMVIYLSIKLIDQVVAELTTAYGPAAPAVVVYRASWPDQQIIRGTLADIAAQVKQAGIERQALILVGPALAAREGRLKAVSKLYDRTFAHGFRGVMDTESIRQSFKPESVRLLLIGESPPASGRFFYVRSAMTTYTSRAFETAHRVSFKNNSDFLNYFKACGCYLDDLSHSPVNQLARREREKHLRDNVDSLSRRIKEVNPPVIAISLKKIEPYVLDAIRKSGCSPQVFILPYAGYGHQNKYIERLALIIAEHIQSYKAQEIK
jgi:hypothetical protein